MLCPTCHGTRKITVYRHEKPHPTARNVTLLSDPQELPCPQCEGFGVVYCCEGSERHGQLPDPPDV